MTDPDQNAPVPPAGYTAEELERDNPHNAWMNDMSLETSEADARPCAYREVEQMMIDGRIKIHRLTAQEIASEFAYTGTRTKAASDARLDPDPYQRASARLEALRTDPVLLAQIESARMSPEPKVSLKVKDGLVMGVGIDLMREWDTVMPSRPINAMVRHASVPGEVLGNGHPDWPDDLTTYAERKAYQRGVADARRVDRASVQLECLVDFVARVTHWTEGGATRHDAILALKQLGVWK